MTKQAFEVAFNDSCSRESLVIQAEILLGLDVVAVSM